MSTILHLHHARQAVEQRRGKRAAPERFPHWLRGVDDLLVVAVVALFALGCGIVAQGLGLL